jgi:hypothetical protein
MFFAPSYEHKIPLSELRQYAIHTDGTATITETALANVLEGHTYVHIAHGDQVVSVLCDQNNRARINADGSFVFFESGEHDMTIFEWQDGNLKKSTDSVNDAQLIGKYLLYTKGGKMYLYGQEKPFEGDYSVQEVLRRGEKVIETVLGTSYQVCPATGALYYQVDKELFKFADGKVTSVCDNVEDWDIAQNGDVWAIVDGTCMIYTGEEIVTVQDDADEIASIPVGGYVGY